MTRPLEQLGFLGAGRMATALARGCVEAGLVAETSIFASDPDETARVRFTEQLPQAVCTARNEDILREAHIVVAAVKPQKIDDVLQEINPHVESRHLIISIAAGITLSRLAAGLPTGTRLVRVMPNTPCLVGQGASGFSTQGNLPPQDREAVAALLGCVGEAMEVDELLLDAVTGLSGSGPAFVYSIIEAMAAGGAAQGLHAKDAVRLAALTVRGAAEMVLRTGWEPAQLRAQVTSPGGTTLAGLAAMEAAGGLDALQIAVEAAARRSRELGQN